MGVVVGYICGWGVVFVGEEKKRLRRKESERGVIFIILLNSLYYFIELYVKIKIGR